MGSHKTWIDLGVLMVCAIAALGTVFAGVNALEASAWMISGGHATLGVLGMIFVIALVNALILIGLGVCKARADARRTPR